MATVRYFLNIFLAEYSYSLQITGSSTVNRQPICLRHKVTFWTSDFLNHIWSGRDLELYDILTSNI